VRSPRDLTALGDVLGFDDGTVERGLAAWGDLAERNRIRTSESFVEPGVRRDES
jgi:ribonuclease P/MRP protein subunit RPP1